MAVWLCVAYLVGVLQWLQVSGLSSPFHATEFEGVLPLYSQGHVSATVLLGDSSNVFTRWSRVIRPDDDTAYTVPLEMDPQMMAHQMTWYNSQGEHHVQNQLTVQPLGHHNKQPGVPANEVTVPSIELEFAVSTPDGSVTYRKVVVAEYSMYVPFTETGMAEVVEYPGAEQYLDASGGVSLIYTVESSSEELEVGVTRSKPSSSEDKIYDVEDLSSDPMVEIEISTDDEGSDGRTRYVHMVRVDARDTSQQSEGVYSVRMTMGAEMFEFKTELYHETQSVSSIFENEPLHVELTSCDGQDGPVFTFAAGLPNCVICRAAHESLRDIEVTHNGWPMGSDGWVTFYLTGEFGVVIKGTVIYRMPGQTRGEYVCHVSTNRGSRSVAFEI